ncbi:CTP:molybdopterin cytidylyltransferase MocA [Palleronia marisminoris]|uniref:Molybdopterin-guanine dinucleotide biosynthesis protein MobA n=1 Tax=Palleronia marisminoris TaxID=315423 RepID=A0A1Y5R8V3_9RHOB|nr:nucleotidyltransferase family protein [Palleronia marisminoris]SFG09110.1 CTP:molybdopterin cytidylyltransferase MocA [Palleronia marisminoris]SLN11787.1 molybdopterin-guanine dinucleotide biosynthesis protein MobA [Palleronia marisminoris]
MVPENFSDSHTGHGVIAILAAGGAKRMCGGDKCLEPIHGVPLLRTMAQRAIATNWSVVVTLPPHAQARRDAVADLPLSLVEVPDASEGMSASFRALSSITTPLMIAFADMPEIETSDFAALIAIYDGTRPVRATAEDGTPGQPVLFPPADVARMGHLSGDVGAKALLRDRKVRLVALPGRRAITDLDTPEAWGRWRTRTGISR